MSDILFSYGVTTPVSDQQETLPVVIGHVSDDVALLQAENKNGIITKRANKNNLFIIIYTI